MSFGTFSAQQGGDVPGSDDHACQGVGRDRDGSEDFAHRPSIFTDHEAARVRVIVLL